MATTPPGPPDLESNGGSVIAAAVTTVSIAAIFVGLRFITRWTVTRALGLSDGAILVALVSGLASRGSLVADTCFAGVLRRKFNSHDPG